MQKAISMRASITVLFSALLLTVFVMTSRAGSIQFFDSVNDGGYNDAGVPISDYIAGYQQGSSGNPGMELRGFILFDLSSLTIPANEMVVKVNLILDTQAYLSPHEGELINFYEVTTDPLAFMTPVFSQTIFPDLGDGDVYGGRLYRPVDAFQTISIPLVELAEGAVEDSSGEKLVTGLRMMTIDLAGHQQFNFNEFVYGGAAGQNPRLEVWVAVPEPRCVGLITMLYIHQILMWRRRKLCPSHC
jgi:hypothetical protein